MPIYYAVRDEALETIYTNIADVFVARRLAIDLCKSSADKFAKAFIYRIDTCGERKVAQVTARS